MEENKFKDTVNLPKTEMPMKAGLINLEPQVLKDWQENKIYEKRLEANKKKGTPFILHDGPPYPNGNIHLGHALNKILKDIIVKYHLLKGDYAPYVPGWDCHGLPIETQLLKDLKKKEVKEEEIDDFRNQCKDYALKFVKTQREQFERLGIFGDFANPYLTLTPEYEKSVIELFGKLAEKDLIFQGKKPIHWCSHCKTALAEAEIEYADETSPSVYVRFSLTEKFEGKKCDLIVWTTTPWTLPANVAVAVNPLFEYVMVKVNNEYFILLEALLSKVTEKLGWANPERIELFKGKELEGLTYTHPFAERVSPVVLAEYVSAEDGTGLVHIAPGHGYDDYLVGREYKLPTIMPVDENGVFTYEAGKYEGLKVFEANKVIVKDMEESGKLLKLEFIKHSYPHCWRCHNSVIFRATEQWFIAMDNEAELRGYSLQAIKDVKWYPNWGVKRIGSMVENRPDWCISRQRFWGIPIPVFYCSICNTPHFKGEFNAAVVDVVSKEGTNAWFRKTAEEILPEGIRCSKCGNHHFIKDKNIMDVWLESGASHHAVVNQREEFPARKGNEPIADLYVEGSDQHRGWFQSSLLTSVGAFGKAPYKAVLTHGFTIDAKGQKMSKSLGNVIDPLNIIKQHGADIIRLWVGSTDFTNDVILSDNIINQIKEAFTKIRNTMRFLISNLYDFDPAKDAVTDFEEVDQWILAKLNVLITDVGNFYNEYELHQIYHHIYNYCVVELSSFYLDIQKDNLYCNKADSHQRRSSQTAMYHIASAIIKMLSPMLSFSMEDVYRFLPGKLKESIFLEEFPVPISNGKDKEIIEKFAKLIELRGLVNVELEKMRKEKTIGSSLESCVEITTPEALSAQELAQVLVVSKITVNSGKELQIKVSRAQGEKCCRCWKYDTLSAQNLCKRCSSVLNS